MIALLFTLLTLLPEATIYPATFAPTPVLARVVANRGWAGAEAFDVLLGMPDCHLLGKWAWVIGSDGVRSGIVVDCASDEDRAQMVADGVIDVSKGQGKGWVVIR